MHLHLLFALSIKIQTIAFYKKKKVNFSDADVLTKPDREEEEIEGVLTFLSNIFVVHTIKSVYKVVSGFEYF